MLVRFPQHLQPQMRQALIALGRASFEKGEIITLAKPLLSLANKQFEIGQFRLGNEEIDYLLRNAYISAVQGITPKPDPPYGQLAYSQQLRCVVGPIYVVFDDQKAPLPRAKGSPIICCSTPGVNIAYDVNDTQRYIDGTKLDAPRYVMRYKVIWAHVLQCMEDSKVEVPVLNAIGCGAFVGVFKDFAPYFVARALAAVLSAKAFGFKALVVCLPDFDDTNFEQFCAAFRVRNRRLHWISGVRRGASGSGHARGTAGAAELRLHAAGDGRARWRPEPV